MSDQILLEKAMRLHQAGNLDKAQRLYQKVIKQTPHQVEALHFLGVLYFQNGKSNRAQELILRALRHAPEYVEARNNLGNIYLKLGRREDARASYEKALEHAPDSVDALNNLGILLQQMGDLEASRACLDRAVILSPQRADVWHNYAHTLLKAGEPALAIEHLQTAIRISPRFSAARDRLGHALFEVGESEAARNVYLDWLVLEPGNPVAEHMLAAYSGAATPGRASGGYLKEIFDNMAAGFDSHLERLAYQAPTLVTRALEQVLPPPDRSLRILDAGCGTGLCGPSMKPYAKNMTGVDISEKMLEQARERRCFDKLVCDDLLKHLQGYSANLDVIVSADTLVYFGELAETMGACHDALVAGGYIAFTLEKARAEQVDGYSLLPHGRYCHRRDYVESVLAGAQLQLISMEEAGLRKEMEHVVRGWVVAAQKPGQLA